MSVHEHEDQARRDRGDSALGVAVVTISDTRSLEEDASGDAIATHLADAGHALAQRRIVRDEPADIRDAIRQVTADPRVDAVLMTGGTGLARRDGTVDVLRALGGVEIEGFGELFRTISFQEIGPAAMLSRACGVVLDLEDSRRIPAFAMPGSVNAVNTAMSHLVIPVLSHATWVTTR
ncbi:MAG: MogA/MoaB family molybdenum cofactor biosynthesis protein [Phycisphaerales bacterium]|nr:MogA/MoaB family molybdenum cofactor biosynthesis protein [Phycisphaerales bacterium]